MGEAKRKSNRLKQFILKHPYCCFCGGTNVTETIDHIPSRQTFRLKRRPAGLEFPACERCNKSTSTHELVAAWMARAYPDPKNEIDKKELQKIMRAIDKNRYGIFQEMIPSWQQRYDYDQFTHQDKPKGGGALNVSGPLLNESIQKFGAKLCLALHYYHRKKIVPLEGGVAIRWYTNWEKITGKLPQEMMKIFTNVNTLSQGRWSVRDQFEYSFALPEDSNMSAFFTTFNQSFAVLGWVQHEHDNFFEHQDMMIHRPGDL